MTDTPKQQLTGIALYVALFVVLFWLAMLTWLAWKAFVADATQWSRLVGLLSSLEAVTFGAAGALFGTQIQRQRVTEAVGRAEKAEKESAENKDAAIKGKALAAAVKAETIIPGASRGHERMSVETAKPDAMTAAQHLAMNLFPD